MRIDISKEWCLRMAELEGDGEIGAGLVAVDPIVSGDSLEPMREETMIVFGRFIRLMRRNRGLSVEKLANDANVDVSELVGIEDTPFFKPERRTVYQLANFFKLPQGRLLELSGLATVQDNRLVQEAVRFAAQSDPTVALTPEERRALEAFVAVLSEKK